MDGRKSAPVQVPEVLGIILLMLKALHDYSNTMISKVEGS